MRLFTLFILALCSGCLIEPAPEGRSRSKTSSTRPPRPVTGPQDVEDLKDNPLPPLSAEPAWRDLVQHTRLLPPARILHPAPSADGKFVAYATSEFGPKTQIVVRDAAAATSVQVTLNGGENLFPRISPCGRLVAYASNREGNWDIYLARLDAPAVVTQVTLEGTDDICPAWSPDGKRLVYASRTGEGPWQIVLTDIASRVKTFLGAGLYPDWSPDPKDPWICFQSQPRDAGGRSAVWVVRPDGTGLREIAGDKGRTWSALHPRYSPCGKWIVYASLRKSPEARLFGAPADADDLWIIRPDGTCEMRLTEEPSGESWPAWGGGRIFFISTRDGARNLYSLGVKPLEDHP